MKPLPYIGLLLGLWGGLGSASPQQPVETPPILSIKTDLVTLPVTVVDRDGRFVTGLRREHFKVFDSDERQTIEFFASDDLPATIGLVIDSSGSMRGRRDDVTAGAAAFAAMSHPLDEFFTVNFNEAVWPGLPPSLAFTGDPNVLHAALSVAPAQGMTALYDAVYHALQHLEFGTRDRKALIVVSDGGDNASLRTLDAVLSQAHQTSAAIYTVTLFDPDNHEAKPQVLRKLAAATGGRVFRPGRVDDVLRSFAEIAREIRSGYTIGFPAPDTPYGGFRAVRVVADAGDGRRLSVRTRAGYYARSSGQSVR